MTQSPTPRPGIAVVRLREQFQVVAIDDMPAGANLLFVNGRITAEPSRYSVQVGANEHVDPPVPANLEDDMDRHVWRFLNHSCAPNAMLRERTLIALRDIARGEEVTFDYATTEYDMAAPFPCGCGAPACRGVISGFKHLTPEQQQALLPHLAAHLRPLAAQVARPASSSEPIG
ncbi:MAG: SET domain-containing protein-lysine N-methyltransferase [Planctomycetota bacterium]